MSISRFVLILGIIVSLSLAGCDRAVVPDASPPPIPTVSGSPPGQSSEPSPSASVASLAQAAVWLDAGVLREARNAAHVVVVGTGEVLVVGSDWAQCGAATNGSDSVESGDPLTGVWEKTTSLPSPRDGPAVVALPDGRALLTGGMSGENVGPSAYSSTYVFDVTTRVWSRSGLLNTARAETAAAVLLDGRVLVAGGLYIDSAASDQDRVLDTSEVWDPRSGTWSATGRQAATRWGASAVTLADGRVLVVGGMASRDSDPIQQASAEIYEPTTGQWSSAGTLAAGRNDFTLVALPDGGALAAGGIGGLGTSAYAIASTVERFDPTSNSWSPAAELPSPRAGATGIRLADGRVLLAGGSVRPAEPLDAEAGTFVSGLTADAVLFDPQVATWTATTPMPSPRYGASAVLLADGSVVFAGGSAFEGNPADSPSCPVADPQVLRYVPGS